MGTSFQSVRGHRRFDVLKAPLVLPGSRRFTPHGSTGLMAGSAACCTPYNSCCPLVPVQMRSTELSRPQPVGSRREVAPCEVTREEREERFKVQRGVSCVGALFDAVEATVASALWKYPSGLGDAAL